MIPIYEKDQYRKSRSLAPPPWVTIPAAGAAAAIGAASLAKKGVTKGVENTPGALDTAITKTSEVLPKVASSTVRGTGRLLRHQAEKAIETTGKMRDAAWLGTKTVAKNLDPTNPDSGLRIAGKYAIDKTKPARDELKVLGKDAVEVGKDIGGTAAKTGKKALETGGEVATKAGKWIMKGGKRVWQAASEYEGLPDAAEFATRHVVQQNSVDPLIKSISLGLFYEMNKVKTFHKPIKQVYKGAAIKAMTKGQRLAINDPSNSKRVDPYRKASKNLLAGATR